MSLSDMTKSCILQAKIVLIVLRNLSFVYLFVSPYFSHMSTTKIRRITIDTASSMMSLNLMIIHVCTLHVALCDDCRFVQLYLHHFRLCSPTSSKENIFVFTLPILRSINFLQNSLIKRSMQRIIHISTISFSFEIKMKV